MNSRKSVYSALFSIILTGMIAIITACTSVSNIPVMPAIAVSRTIYSTPTRGVKSLELFFLSHRPKANKWLVRTMARLYLEECAAEGINSDVAFIQMCHETNFLEYGNLVTKDMNNFCGLGAIGPEQRGLKFATKRLGVRSHVQHLHAYGTTEDIKLNNELIDPRYKYVRPRGKAPDIAGLTGTWAADPAYAEKLERYLCELENF